MHSIFITSIRNYRRKYIVLTDRNNTLWQTLGSTSGHPSMGSAKCAEICSILASLFVLHWICMEYNIHRGGTKLVNDLVMALIAVFTPLLENRLSINSIHVTLHLSQPIQSHIHIKDLELKIMKDIGWTESQFHCINWDAQYS
jgi:hypothetical protein